MEVISNKKRKDAYGTYINKDNIKQIKVSFVDLLSNNGPSETMEPRTLVEYIEVMSYKQYNVIDDEEQNQNNFILEDKDGGSAGSCLII